jgi:hypothetical protein
MTTAEQPTENEWHDFLTFVEQLADGDVEDPQWEAHTLLRLWGIRDF